MIAARIVTCLLGLVLLIPFTASFWKMASHRQRSEAELQKSLDDALATLKAEMDSRVTPDFLGAMGGHVEIDDVTRLPLVSYRLWSPFTRRWVGVVGLTCCLIITGLWVFSAFFPAKTVSGGYSIERTGPDLQKGGTITIQGAEGADSGSWTVPPEKNK